jgi:hypothetical protein
MKEEFCMIPITKIKPLFTPYITKEFNRRMKSVKAKHLAFDLLLAVEKHPQEDSYILVGGYDKYFYIHACKEINEVRCIIEEFITPEETLLKTFRRLLPRGDNNKENRLQLIDFLREFGFDNLRISTETGLKKSYLDNSYTYGENVPQEYIKNNTTLKTLNSIAMLDFSPEAKRHLYQRANIPKGNPQRLTGQVLNYIISFRNIDGRVKLLTPTQQILTLDQAFNPKNTVMKKLKDTVNRFMPYKRTS